MQLLRSAYYQIVRRKVRAEESTHEQSSYGNGAARLSIQVVSPLHIKINFAMKCRK